MKFPSAVEMVGRPLASETVVAVASLRTAAMLLAVDCFRSAIWPSQQLQLFFQRLDARVGRFISGGQARPGESDRGLAPRR